MDARKQSTSKKRIVVVDDHPLMRSGMIQLINQEEDLAVVGEADCAENGMRAIEDLQPDLAIVDLSLEGKDVSGLDLIRSVHGRHPRIPILVLSMHDENLYAERALRSGAKGYLMKQEPAQKVITAIQKLLAGEIYVSKKMNAQILKHHMCEDSESRLSPSDMLSDREFDVYRLIGQGLKPQEIAEQLNLSVKTIEAHRANIRKKLNLKTASALTRHAIQWMRDE